MEQKSESKRPRGRPRSYEPETALRRAMEAFWDGGYSGTSLDQLSAATGLNRPSLYGAFGDKQALYLKTLQRYAEGSRAMIRAAFTAEQPLRDALMQVYSGAIATYVAGENGQRGCFFVGTAAVEAATNPLVRKAFARSTHDLDEAFAQRIRLAVQQGELPADADAKMLGRLATSVIHTLALRARAGEPRAALTATAKAAVELICAPEKARRKRP